MAVLNHGTSSGVIHGKFTSLQIERKKRSCDSEVDSFFEHLRNRFQRETDYFISNKETHEM
jgi:hypothetical protein